MKTILGFFILFGSSQAQVVESRNINNVGHKATAAQTAAWTSVTALDTAMSVTVGNYSTVALSFNPSGSITAGAINFEASDDAGTTWYTATCVRSDSQTAEINFTITGTKKLWQCSVAGFTTFRVRLNPVITGAGTANIRQQGAAAPVMPLSVTSVSNTPPVSQSGTWTVQPGNTANTTPWLATINQGGNSAIVSAANALKIDGSAVTHPISISAANFPDNEPFNVAQIAGTATSVNNGVAGAGVQRVAIASDNSAVSGMGVGATGSAVPANAQFLGLRNDAGNLTGAIRCDLKANFDQAFTAAQSVQLVALVSAQKIYICHASFVASAASSVKFTEGTGTNCGTGKTTVAGAYPVAANGGVVLPFGLNPLEIATAGDALCVESSAAVTVAGVVQYAQF